MPAKPKGYSNGRKCCKCENTYTSIYQGNPLWYKDKDKYGIWTGRYICKKCYYRPIDKTKFFDNRTCCKCGADKTYIDSFGRHVWRRYRKNGVWDGKSYVCDNCHHKSKTKCRNRQLDKDTSLGKTIIFQAIIKKIIGAIDCTIKANNCNYPIDVFDREMYGKVDVKYSTLNEDGEWYFCTRGKIDADTYFCLGLSADSENIEKIWIIPNEDWVVNLKGIFITKDSCMIRTYHYNQYEVDSKLYDDAYHSLMSFLGNNKYFGIEDIKKWLKIGKEIGKEM